MIISNLVFYYIYYHNNMSLLFVMIFFNSKYEKILKLFPS